MRLVATLFVLFLVVASAFCARIYWRRDAYNSIGLEYNELTVVEIMGKPTYIEIGGGEVKYIKRDLSVCRETCARRLWYEDGPLSLLYGSYVFDFNNKGRLIYKGEMYSP